MRYFWKYPARFLEWLLDGLFYLPSGGEKRFKKRCISNTGLTAGMRVLDLCCGKGYLSSMIAELLGGEGQVIGLDIDGNSLNMAIAETNWANVHFINADSGHIPLSPDIIDSCLILLGMHHMSADMRATTLSEVYRVLKTGGCLFIVDYGLSSNLFSRIAARTIVGIIEDDAAYRMLMDRSLWNEAIRACFTKKKKKSIQGQVIQILQLEKR